jgi:hypothetical protein
VEKWITQKLPEVSVDWPVGKFSTVNFTIVSISLAQDIFD